VTVQNNAARGGDAQGGGIYNQGALTLQSVVVQNNIAQGGTGGDGGRGGTAEGGAVYSSGPLIVDGSTIQNNAAIGGRGGDGAIVCNPFTGCNIVPGGDGGWAVGGGLFIGGNGWVAPFSVTINNTNLTANTAQGGDGGGKGVSYRGGNGGLGLGAGLYVESGPVAIHTSTVIENVARGGQGGAKAKSGQGAGGGIYIVTANNDAAEVGLDAFTVRNVKRNHANKDANISGPYDLIL
jgi:hypothetical protein